MVDAVKSAAIHGYKTISGAPAQRCQVAFYEAELPISPSMLIPLQEEDVQRKGESLACYQSQWGGAMDHKRPLVSRPSCSGLNTAGGLGATTPDVPTPKLW